MNDYLCAFVQPLNNLNVKSATVTDVDAARRDPADSSRLNPALDSGDGLHPSLEGYRAMAASVPLDLLR